MFDDILTAILVMVFWISCVLGYASISDKMDRTEQKIDRLIEMYKIYEYDVD